MILLAAAGILLLAAMFAVALLNYRDFPRLGAPAPGPAPANRSVSILIPARNEAGRIGITLRRLIAQRPRADEILVLDDQSSDRTAAEAGEAAAADARVRVLAGRPLPPAWVGKNWACQQLADAAAGECLIFTDADVDWQDGALEALLDSARRLDADLLTVWPTQVTESWGERLVVPMMSFAVQAYLPLQLVHRFYRPEAAAANGQCLVFTREAYDRIGGHAAVAQAIVEDVQLARHIKAAGLRLRMADGNGLVRCRMYRSWPEVRDGFAKSLLAGHGDSILLLALSTLLHLGLFVAPWAWLLLGSGSAGWPVLPTAMIALGLGARAISAATTGQRIADALLLPVSVLLMSRIALQATWWRLRHGGPVWKDRRLAMRQLRRIRSGEVGNAPR